MQRSSYVLLVLASILNILVGVTVGGIVGVVVGHDAVRAALSPTPLEDSALVTAVQKVRPAVVTIINQMKPRESPVGYTQMPTVSGSGVVIDPQGYIVTNNHVVAGTQTLSVIFLNGSKTTATIIGANSVIDLAVVKVDVPVPAVAVLGDSSQLKLGQVVIAIGSPLDNFPGTVTMGVVSGLDRQIGENKGLIQTDASINTGNSGGPLIDAQGRVIGINTLVVRSTGNGDVAQGLSFSIPSNRVREVVMQWIAEHKAGGLSIGMK